MLRLKLRPRTRSGKRKETLQISIYNWHITYWVTHYSNLDKGAYKQTYARDVTLSTSLCLAFSG